MSFRGRAQARSPESIPPVFMKQAQRQFCVTCDYGFRARRFAAPRNDGVSLIRFDIVLTRRRIARRYV